MTKITLDVALLVVTQDLTARAGDSLILYNDQIIGVVPKGTPGSPQPTVPNNTSSPLPPVNFDYRKVLALFAGPVKAWRVYDINKACGWLRTPAAGQCSQWMHKRCNEGFFTKSADRYPIFTLTKESADTDSLLTAMEPAA